MMPVHRAMIFTIARVAMGACRTLREAGRRVGNGARVSALALLLVWAAPTLATNWTFNWGTAAANWPLAGWTTTAWPACGTTGTVSNSRTFTNVNASGIDVTATITLKDGCFVNTGCTGSTCPALDYNANGGAAGSPADLDLNVDFTNLTTSSLSVLIQFSAPVAMTGWAVRDIDRTTSNPFWQDVVKATAVNASGSTINPDFISQFVANGSENWTPASPAPAGTNTLAAKGTANLASINQAGWATFVFGSQKIQSMTMQWTPGDGGGVPTPGAQRVFLSNFVFSNVAVTTQALISSFGVGSDGTVEWETASEVGTAGFNLFRRDPATGGYVRLNDRLLPALIGAPHGGVYRYADGGIVPGETYTYGLEEVEARGTTRLYGPFTAVAGRGKQPSAGSGIQPLARATTSGSSLSDRYTRQAHVPNGREVAPLAIRRVTTQVKAAAVHKPATPNTALRILVEQDGLYAVTADQIAAALGTSLQQVRTWIRKNQLRLQQKGQAVAWMADPGNERLYFYGQAIAGADSVYTRYNVYWLDQADGVAMTVREGTGPGAVATPQYFPSRVHAEDNNCPATFVATDPDADFWYANAVQVSASGQNHVAADCFSLLPGPPTFAVSAPDPAPGGDATLRAYLQGATDLVPGNDHLARVLVNGAEVGNVAWDGIAPRTLTATFNASLLAADGNNTITVQGALMPGADYGVFWVDSFDLDYRRAYQASGDQLRLTGAGNGVVTVGGFSGSYITVLDISDPRKPQRLAATTVTLARSGYAVSFAPAKANTDYIAAVARAPAMVEGATLPTVKSRDNAASYLVLTPGSLRDGANILAAYRGAKVLELQDIYDAFSYGIANPNAIHDFLAYAYQNWQPRPRFVALVGKGTIDPKDYMRLGSNRFPVLMSSTPHGLFASDNRYADFNANGVPDLAIGRIPAFTSDDVIRYVAKVTDYEKRRPPANQALLVADIPDEGGDFTADSRAVAQALKAKGFSIMPVNLDDMAVEQARQTIIDTLNSPTGVGLFNFVGHGGVNVLSNAAVFSNDDVSQLRNGARLPVFLAFTCAAGDGSYPGYDSLAETLLWRDGGGAIAAVAPTGLSDNGQAHTLNMSLVGTLVGPRASATLGDATTAALADFARKGAERYMLDKYSVMGDPALRVQQ